jgi:four helix bundle protein
VSDLAQSAGRTAQSAVKREAQGGKAKGEVACAPAFALDTSSLALSAHAHMRPHFRFEDLEIWQLACDLAVKLHTLAGRLDERRFHRYAEQLRGAGLSLTNNIAEGSGSVHQAEFRQFLNIARRSLFEDASMLLVFQKLKVLTASEVDELLEDCDKLSRKITKFSRSLE